jgi:hypothetical protein
LTAEFAEVALVERFIGVIWAGVDGEHLRRWEDFIMNMIPVVLVFCSHNWRKACLSGMLDKTRHSMNELDGMNQ